jgi:hypothetical protein
MRAIDLRRAATPQSRDTVTVRAVEIAFRNSGEAHLKTRGSVELRRGDNTLVTRLDIPEFPSVPGSLRRVTVELPADLAAGAYVALALLDYAGQEIAAGQVAVMALALVSVWADASTVRAQVVRTTLTITDHTIAFASPTGADFLAGYIDGGASTFSIEATSGPAAQRTASVSIRCSGCPVSGPKALATLQWRRADLPTWNTLTTGYVEVEERIMWNDLFNDPWTNQVFWRFALDWLGDPPGAQTEFRIEYLLTVTLP